jgi:short chain dehydrogenase
MTTSRTAIITGATSDRGIGMTVAQRYAKEGWGVVILDLDGEKSAKVAAEIGSRFAVPAFGYAVDVTSEDSVTARPATPLPPRSRAEACLPYARWPTSPASRRRCRSSRPPSTFGTP